MKHKRISDCRDPDKIKRIFTEDFNARVDKMVERSLELTPSYTLNAPSLNLGEATECFIHGYFGASIALSRTTLEQTLKHKLNIRKDEIVSLDCLIKLVTAQCLLDINLRTKAMNVQRCGNTYIHDTKKKDTEHEKQKKRAKEVLLSVKRIVEKLYSD